MNTVFALLSFQALLGAFDNLWHHEWEAKLPQRVSARRELRLHAAREALYALLFIGLAWFEWHGLFAALLAGVLGAELCITLADFLEEDRTRRLPPFERWLHTVLTVSYGLFIGLLAPIAWAWSQQPSALVLQSHGWVSALFTLYGLGVGAWSLRNALAVRRLGAATVPELPRPDPSAPAVLVAGATGFVGQALVAQLRREGRRVIALSRDVRQARALFDRGVWVVERLEDIPAETRIEAVINLAGARVLGLPWTAARRRELLWSRARVAADLLMLMRRLQQAPKVLVAASAVGFYGARNAGAPQLEDAAPAAGEFQAELCAAVEHEARRAEALGVRVVRLRFGVVLGRGDGAYPPLALAARLGLAAVLGSGSQPAPWIHLDDAVGLIRFALTESQLEGAVNACAPQAVDQAGFTQALAASFGRQVRLRLPAAPLRRLAGEMSTLLLDGQCAQPLKALAAGYRFSHAGLDQALANLARCGQRGQSRPMALLSLTNAHLAFGHWPLLDAAEFSLEAGERVGLIGRNGCGKSSLLKVLAGLEKLDDGLLQRSLETRVVYVPQEPEFAPGATVFEAVSEGVAEARDLRARFEAHEGEDLDALQTRIEALGGWTWEQRVAESLQRLGLDGTRRVEELSGGLKKRVALARALVAQPDVLLLDEPTNHLDLDAILWLEGLLREFPGSLLVITHDRAFLDGVCTRIVELDRGLLRGYPGNFAAFEAAKQRELEAEALANARFDKLLAQEEVWIRKGVEARRTRSVARVARLVALREQHAQRRNLQGKAQLKVDAGEASGKLVAELEDVSKGFAGAPPVVKGLSATFMRGDKVGLVGPNGAGKTTLLKLILGELQPDSGTVRTGTKIQVAHFDQMRAGLNLDATLADTISPGSEWVEIAGNRQHVMTYLQNFLFAPQRANSPVRTLSGGERNRLLLARLFARPANVLVLDEPTNDLDVETLDLLEELLIDYPGTVFLVSHDRRFLDHVVTSTLVAEGQGVWKEYEGGVEDWLLQSQRARAAAQAAAAPKPEPAKAAPAPRSEPALKRKLSYKEQRELEALPAQIEALEAEQAELHALMNGSELYTQGAERISQVTERAAAIDEQLLALLERWTALSD